MSRASSSAAAQLPDAVQQAIRDFNTALARSNLHISSLVLEHASLSSEPGAVPLRSKEEGEGDPLLLVLNANDATRAKNSLRASVPTDSPSLTPLRLPSTLLHTGGTGGNLPIHHIIPSPNPLPHPVLPNPSSLLAPLPLPPPTALKRSSAFGSTSPQHSDLPFKRSRSNPDTSSIPRQRPLSMSALRSPAPFWGTVLTPPSAPAGTAANPRDDPRFLPLLQDTLSKKLASNTNIPNIPVTNTTSVKLQPSPLVSHVRSHAVASGTPPFRSHSASAPYVAYGGARGGGGGSGSVGVRRPRTSLPHLELGSIRIGSSGGPGVGGIPSANTASAPLLPRIGYASAGNQSATSSVGSTSIGVGIGSGGAGTGTTTGSGSVGAFACQQCEAAFKRRSDMNRHVRVVHEKQRPFQCPTCMQRFGEKGNMQKHIRMVHQNIRGFHCQHCGASFGQRGNCESHIRSVHEKRPGKYECSLCNNRAFARKAHLLDHFASDHPGIPPPSARARPRAPIPRSYPPSATGTQFLGATPNTNAGNIPNLPPPPSMFGAAGGQHRNQHQQLPLPPLSIPVSLPPASAAEWRPAGGSSAGDAAVRRKRDEPDARGR